MKKLKLSCALALTSFAFVFLPSSSGYCSATYEITAEELTTLETNLSALEQNNNELRNLLTASNLDLTTLQTQLKASENQITQLENQLAELRSESETAKASLTTANEELAKAEKSLNEYAREQERVQSKLRTQKTLWQILAISLGVYAVAK